MTSTAAGRPTRATYKGHGRPADGFYFGNGRTPAGTGQQVTLRAIGTLEVFDAATGERIAEHRGAAQFWYAPATTVDTTDIDQARIDAAHAEAETISEVRRLTDGRVTEPTVALLYSALRCARIRAAQAGNGALAIALAERIAELQPAYDADEDERAADMEAQKARIIAQRAAEATPDDVVIVPCGGRKLDTAAPAGELYTGSYHQACRRAAAARGGRVFILSALHGLLTLDQEIAPYDLRMGQPGSVTPAQVRGQAWALGILDARVTVLAGKAYADVVSAVWPDADRPLDGTRGIGPQLARLKVIATQPRPQPRRSPAQTQAPTPRRARRAPAVMAGQLDLFAAAAA